MLARKYKVWPALAWNSFSFPGVPDLHRLRRVAVRVAFTSLPSFHSISTPIPPRARNPVTFPDGNADGSAGSRLMNAASPDLHRRQARRRRIRVVALQQHLRDPGGRAEIAVDLERRMRVEQVREQPRLVLLVRRRHDQVLQNLVSVVAVEEPRPQIQLPAHRPSRRRVAAENQRLPRRLEQVGRAVRR